MSIDTSLIAFKAITNFTNELEELFGAKQHSLRLYSRLINKTTLAHDKPIQKHIEAFRLFCQSNRDAITEKNMNKLNNSNIQYSERVFINMKNILAMADTETQTVIWKHLLLISAILDPSGRAKELLREACSSDNTGTESNFLTDIINKVEEHVDPNASPMEAIASIMKSGVFTDLVSGMNNGLQDGSLDLSKLLGSVQGMVTKLSNKNGSEGSDDSLNMINNMVGMLGKQNGEDGGNNMTELMAMMGPMLATLNTAMPSRSTGSVQQQLPDIMNMISSLNMDNSKISNVEQLE
jgi:hypothetical protein|uniref:Uncharacterized protein n=1 Tax=viral metagenome TaxID=1070528 RepID=A0A6C0CZ21_9ZZZZ